jgi:exonuclease III
MNIEQNVWMKKQKLEVSFVVEVMVEWQLSGEKSIDHAIKYYNDGNERINVITVNIKEQSLCIISVYMPSENSNRDEKYKDTMAQLEEIINKFAVDHQIMTCGDFNASGHRDNRSRDRRLKHFTYYLQMEIQRNQLFSTTI